MMAVQIRDGAAFEAGVPKPLFDVRLSGAINNTGFDVGPDGRFLIPTVVEQPAAVPITVVVNWLARLKK